MESVWVLKKLCTHVINLAQDGADGHYLQDVKFCFSKIFRTSWKCGPKSRKRFRKAVEISAVFCRFIIHIRVGWRSISWDILGLYTFWKWLILRLCCRSRIGYVINMAITSFDSPLSENPMLHANSTALCVIEPEFRSIEVSHCGNRDFRPFLLLWPDDLYIRTWPVFLEIYRMCKYELVST